MAIQDREHVHPADGLTYSLDYWAERDSVNISLFLCSELGKRGVVIASWMDGDALSLIEDFLAPRFLGRDMIEGVVKHLEENGSLPSSPARQQRGVAFDSMSRPRFSGKRIDSSPYLGTVWLMALHTAALAQSEDVMEKIGRLSLRLFGRCEGVASSDSHLRESLNVMRDWAHLNELWREALASLMMDAPDVLEPTPSREITSLVRGLNRSLKDCLSVCRSHNQTEGLSDSDYVLPPLMTLSVLEAEVMQSHLLTFVEHADVGVIPGLLSAPTSEEMKCAADSMIRRWEVSQPERHQQYVSWADRDRLIAAFGCGSATAPGLVEFDRVLRSHGQSGIAFRSEPKVIRDRVKRKGEQVQSCFNADLTQVVRLSEQEREQFEWRTPGVIDSIHWNVVPDEQFGELVGFLAKLDNHISVELPKPISPKNTIKTTSPKI